MNLSEASNLCPAEEFDYCESCIGSRLSLWFPKNPDDRGARPPIATRQGFDPPGLCEQPVHRSTMPLQVGGLVLWPEQFPNADDDRQGVAERVSTPDLLQSALVGELFKRRSSVASDVSQQIVVIRPEPGKRRRC